MNQKIFRVSSRRKAMDQEKMLTIDYTNYRGERSERRIVPKKIIFDSNEWHKEKQWLLEAHDVEKNQVRFFSIKDIHNWLT